MGHTRTPAFRVQIEKEKDVYIFTGADSYREAIRTIMEYCTHYNTTKGYIWPQTAKGRRLLHGYNCQSITVMSDSRGCGCIVNNIDMEGGKYGI